jgi:hypothetical protein
MNASLSSASTANRHSIYVLLAALAVVIAVAGFWRTYFGPLFTGVSSEDWLAHLHAAVFMGWIGLVGLQARLAISGRRALHVKIGRFGMAYGALLVITGLAFAVVRFTQRVAEVGPDALQGGFLVPLTDMGVFSLFLAGAWFTRRRPEFHRRFILLATTTILIAAVGRMFGGTKSVALRDVVPFVLVWLSPVWIAMLYDWFKARTVHVVYVFGAALLIALRYRQLIRETETWMAISRRFAHWVADHLL